MHSSTVTSPALAYDGALQAAYTKDSVAGYMSNPSQSAAPQSFGAAGALPEHRRLRRADRARLDRRRRRHLR